MATAFSPSVGRVFIDADAYPSGTSTSATYQQPKLDDIAAALVNTGEGWSVAISHLYNSTYGGWVMLERTSGSDVAQIVLAYYQSLSHINAANRYSVSAASYKLWICYKPSTTGSDIVNTGAKSPNDVTFCSDGNSFLFAPVDYAVNFYNTDARYTWFVDGERVILVAERPLHSPTGITAFGPDILANLYNTGTAKWLGGSDISHPEPDTYPELFYNRYYSSMTPGQDTPTSLQWYKTDGTWSGTHGDGVAIRGEWIQNSTPNGEEPYLREPLNIYSNVYGAVWPSAGGSTGNGLKGSVDMDFLSAVNAGAAAENLTGYQRLESNTFMHIADGLCIGWDPAYGPMPT